jgi:DNA-binding transcriptional MerR regulator
MNDAQPYELPKASEKLADKFIFDSLRDEIVPEEGLAETPIAASPPAEETTDGRADSGDALSGFEPLELPPGKKYFRIREVSELTGVEPYVLRYWENEFPTVRPTKSRTGQRVYSRRDVEELHLIRHLLHVEKFSIKGAKKKIAERRQNRGLADRQMRQRQLHSLRELAHQLRELVQLIRTNPGLPEAPPADAP